MKIDCMKIQKAAWFTPRDTTGEKWGLVLNWTGSPGQGKSAKLEALARECGLLCQVVLAGLREPADFNGLPIPVLHSDGRMRVDYAPPSFVTTANDETRGSVIYLDEFNHASPSVQGAAQRMLLEGIVGDTKLSPRTRFVLSMNTIDQAATAGGSSLSMALANRVGHMLWEDLDPQEWGTWMLGGGAQSTRVATAADIEAAVWEQWPNVYAKCVGLIVSFVQRHSSKFSVVPSAASDAASGAWASPRTWEFAARAMASGLIHKLNVAEQLSFVGGFVGHDVATEFFGWVEKNDLPDPVELLEGRLKFEPDPRRLDRTHATLSSCAAICMRSIGTDKINTYCASLFDMLADTSLAGSKDLIIPVARQLMQAMSGGSMAFPPGLFNKRVRDNVLSAAAELNALYRSLE